MKFVSLKNLRDLPTNFRKRIQRLSWLEFNHGDVIDIRRIIYRRILFSTSLKLHGKRVWQRNEHGYLFCRIFPDSQTEYVSFGERCCTFRNITHIPFPFSPTFDPLNPVTEQFQRQLYYLRRKMTRRPKIKRGSLGSGAEVIVAREYFSRYIRG